jgi:hypothetical protein
MGRKKSAWPMKSVRIHEDVYEKAVIAAAIEKKEMTDFLSGILRPIIQAFLDSHGYIPRDK